GGLVARLGRATERRGTIHWLEHRIKAADAAGARGRGSRDRDPGMDAERRFRPRPGVEGDAGAAEDPAHGEDGAHLGAELSRAFRRGDRAPVAPETSWHDGMF